MTELEAAMRWRIPACAVLVAMLMWPAAARAQKTQSDRILSSIEVFEQIMQSPEHAIPQAFLQKAEAIVVFPGTFKGGLILGVHRGKGIISVREPLTGVWSPPSFMTITGVSVGAQIGFAETDIVLIVVNRRGIENLLRSKFKIGADAGVAAGPIGRDAEASTDLQLKAQILSYSRSRGLFAGATIKGSVVNSDGDANRNFYGRKLTPQQIVYEGIGSTVEPVPAWNAMLKKYFQ